ncbi:MAG: UxaA family hydrolase [Chloroflexota bacterium]|nr:UxaA family hydrolase [Chloroflexota bacterium]
MAHGALMHESGDDVAVVIEDVTSGDEVKVVALDGEDFGVVKATEDIPLGHKIALRDMSEGEDVIKYGRAIGRTRKDVAKGAHVHTQNVVSIRWETSIDE